MKSLRTIFGLLLLAAVLPACHSQIQPLQPLQRTEVWIPDDGGPAITLSTTLIRPEILPPASQPATRPAPVHPIKISSTMPATAPTTQLATTQPAATQSTESAPATQTAPLPPGHKITKIIDPNQTLRFVYNASYDNIWQQAILLVHHLGFRLDQQDYRLGILTSAPLPSSQIVEFWKPQLTSANNAWENTVNSQRRALRLTISEVPNKPKFYEIAVQVLVQRETNPTEALTGPIFIEGSGFGRNAIALRSDYADPSATMAPTKTHSYRESTNVLGKPLPAPWVILGHDSQLEKKLLDQLFNRI